MEAVNIKLLINGVDIVSDVHPVFGDDVKIKIAKEENQIFRRETIDGTFKFFGADFDLIYGCSVYTKFTLEVYRGSALVGTADFLRTDCEFNLDDRICKVKLVTKDIYEKFLNSYDNKYNLVKLAPERESVQMTKRAILQFYVRGEDVVTNVVGGVSYEQSCKEVYDADKLKEIYHFGGYIPLAYIQLTNALSPLAPSGVLGRYVLDKSLASGTALFYVNELDSRYQIQLTPLITYVLLLIDTAENKAIASGEMDTLTSGTMDITFLSTGSTQTNYVKGQFHSDGDLFCRMLLARNAENAFERSVNDDITEYDLNYPYVGKVSLDTFAKRFSVVPDKSTRATEWGIDSGGSYFKRPVLNYSQRTEGVVPIPIGQSHWERMSSWLMYDSGINDIINYYDTPFVLKDSYPLWSAIKVLLNEVDSSLTFENTEDYSIFLFRGADTMQFLDSYNFLSFRSDLYITPITNVKKTFYEQAAQRGDISLMQILNMLRNVYQCYWWIDSERRLRIEHIIYFKNGNTYTSEHPVPTIDVTEKINLPTKESWDFAQNTISFVTNECPSRYEFKWGEKSTYPFEGEAIVMSDKYLDASRKEDVSVDNFVADIDYIITNGSQISNDVYAVYEATRGDLKRVSIVDVRLDDTSPKYRLQNGFMSFLFAERYYYPYNLSGWRAKAGDATIDVVRTKAIVKQELSCPLSLDEMRSIGVVRSELGDGMIEDTEAEICTLYAKNKVMYEQKENIADKVYFYDYALNQGKIVFFNPTNKKARVRYALMEGSKIISINEIDIALKGSVDVNVGNMQSAMILDVEDISAFSINRTFRKANGAMTLDDRASANGVYVLDILGNGKAGFYDYAGIHITAHRQIKITLSCSTESGADVGYINSASPYCGGTLQTDVSISGINSTTLTLQANESRYIGYRKNGSRVENEDKVTITIEEI